MLVADAAEHFRDGGDAALSAIVPSVCARYAYVCMYLWGGGGVSEAHRGGRGGACTCMFGVANAKGARLGGGEDGGTDRGTDSEIDGE